MDLGHLLAHLKGNDDPDLLVGFDTSDDAGVYRVREDLALVQTVDLITPVCDDPYRFGQVAAANSLSDVYAMGGRPLTALNICCFPAKGVPEGIFEAILRGGFDTIRQAGAVLAGGHTVRDAELKYGLAVTGTIHPDRILRNAGARAGDQLVLTKPVGTGLMITASRKEMISGERFDTVIQNMARLNDTASELALAHDASACTDITGFGLAGHTLEVARASRVGIRLSHAAVPFYFECLDLAHKGLKTAVTESNRELAGREIRFEGSLTDDAKALYFDPQTSGGLLIAVASPRAGALLSALHARGLTDSSLVGEVISTGAPLLEVVPS